MWRNHVLGENKICLSIEMFLKTIMCSDIRDRSNKDIRFLKSVFRQKDVYVLNIAMCLEYRNLRENHIVLKILMFQKLMRLRKIMILMNITRFPTFLIFWKIVIVQNNWCSENRDLANRYFIRIKLFFYEMCFCRRTRMFRSCYRDYSEHNVFAEDKNCFC